MSVQQYSGYHMHVDKLPPYHKHYEFKVVLLCFNKHADMLQLYHKHHGFMIDARYFLLLVYLLHLQILHYYIGNLSSCSKIIYFQEMSLYLSLNS
jgi:hypothetical protein